MVENDSNNFHHDAAQAEHTAVSVSRDETEKSRATDVPADEDAGSEALERADSSSSDSEKLPETVHSDEVASTLTPESEQPRTTETPNSNEQVDDDAAQLARMAMISSRVRQKQMLSRSWTPSSLERQRRHWSRELVPMSAAARCGLPPTIHVQHQHGEHGAILFPSEDASHVSSVSGSHPEIPLPCVDSGSDVDDDVEAPTTCRDDSSQESDDARQQRGSSFPHIPDVSGIYTHTAAPDSKFASYACLVDSTQQDRSVEIHIGSFRRPHMRAFFCSTLAFFVAFFTWFALTPLLTEIQRSLDLTREEIWTSSTFAVAGSAVTRILIGPVNDICGARWSMSGTLVLSAIPTGLVGLVNTAEGLNVIRLFIGVAGSSFVTCQYWTQAMFTNEISGTANALAAGWGNLGGGVTQIVMGSILFPLFKIIYGGSGWMRSDSPKDDDLEESSFDRASDLSWRTICVFPAVLCLVTAYFVVRSADDSPKGNYRKRNRQGLMPSVSARKVLKTGLKNRNTWVLFVQYGLCFGVEITMTNAAALYFKEEFSLTTESAAAIASIFGWMNLFARGVGGFVSDMANAKSGMRGRLWVHVILLVMEGAMVLIFAQTHTLAAAIVVMIVFSTFVQAAEGSTFAIVPYVNPDATGSISGIVGAGGNVGGVGLSILFREYDYRPAFSAMGIAAILSALPTLLISFQGHRSLLCGKDAAEVFARRMSHVEQLGSVPNVNLVSSLSGGGQAPPLNVRKSESVGQISRTRPRFGETDHDET